MSLGQKISRTLRDAFIRALHQESADDFDRKAGVAQTIIAQSADVIPSDDKALRETLMQTRTAYLDVLAANKVAVGFDARLNKQKLDDKDNQIDGVFYPAKEDTPAIVTLGRQGGDAARFNSNLLEKLATALPVVPPATNLYAYSTVSMTMTPDMGVVVEIASWTTNNIGRSVPLHKNPELKQPPVKSPGSPKPN
ncbi:MAG: hypothetical protein JNM12_08525 [Alphaproteobacteria bacterium]|nr:hypothetical protein [Alphaproteobacteria bacterium]